MKFKKIGIIGLGNMGNAILQGLIYSGTTKKNGLIGYDCDALKCRAAKKDFGISITASVNELAHRSDVVLIAVKPQNAAAIFEELSSSVEGRLFVSIAAGIKTCRIEKVLGGRPRVVRVMPNTPALVREGMSAICKGKYATALDVKISDEIFASVGDTIVLDEKYFDLVTAISGSGPAYFFYLKEAIIEAAVHSGLDKTTAKRLISKTAFGAAKLLIETGYEPEILRQRVTSKGGTTEQAIKVFEREKFKRIVEDAIIAAVKRSKELSGG